MAREKKDKINEFKRLIAPKPESKLNDDDISFLKDRKVDCEALLTSKQPLIIYATDSGKTANKIVSIADKLDCPVIRLVHNVIKSGTEPGKVVIMKDPPEDKPRLRKAPKPIVKKVEEPKEVKEPEEVQEDEPVIKPGVKYRISGPSIWEGLDDEDDNDMRIKTYF